jgi:hypothetical protein
LAAAGAFRFLALASFIADAGSDTDDASREPANSPPPPPLAAGTGGGSPKRLAAPGNRCPLKLDSRAARAANPGSPQNLSRQSSSSPPPPSAPSTPKSSLGDELSRLAM